MIIHPVLVELYQSGPKWWADILLAWLKPNCFTMELNLLLSHKENKLIDAVVPAIVVVPQSISLCFCSNSDGYGCYNTHIEVISSTESQEK